MRCAQAPRAARSGDKRHLAAEEIARIEPAEHQVGVGHGRLRPAAAVAGRARHRAGAARTDVQPALLVEPGDRAAADADLEDVDDVAADREAGVGPADVIDRSRPRSGRARSSRISRWFRPCRRRPDCRRRARGRSRAAPMQPPTGPDSTSVIGSRQPRSAEITPPCEPISSSEPPKPPLRRSGIELGDVLAHLRPDVGVGRRGRGALELMPLAGQLRAGGDEHVRQQAAQLRGGLPAHAPASR